MGWHARLSLDYSLDAERQRTIARHRHSGPLRVLQSLYPEGDAVCHNVLIHPPGGLVGGDVLDIDLQAGSGSHGLVTTPGASRFYRSEGEPAVQRTRLRLAPGARLEWLPLEAICYSACRAGNHLRIEADPGAELIGWDVVALGLPGASQPFAAGSLQQHVEVPGVWLERGRIDAGDKRLLDGPLGLGGHRCMASLFLVSGSPLPRARREAALDAARAQCEASALAGSSGVTSTHAQVVVVRVLAPLVEPAMALLRQIWQAWRVQLWQMPPTLPRIWSM
ncbi:urease accessory protein UreD [Variovorax sp.]|uniref:urease accessory protein UreD n=1 Tax=Variovorax sp. TaxID=1871043 RepID=UPI002D5053CD|nr:urease accessory protein UreD [Variovorax sp.]HYP85609.1 urease accessory protein UreD [Variovorax sp.]